MQVRLRSCHPVIDLVIVISCHFVVLSSSHNINYHHHSWRNAGHAERHLHRGRRDRPQQQGKRHHFCHPCHLGNFTKSWSYPNILLEFTCRQTYALVNFKLSVKHGRAVRRMTTKALGLAQDGGDKSHTMVVTLVVVTLVVVTLV